MYEGAKGWLLVAGWWLLTATFAVFLPYGLMEEFPPDERRNAWLLLAGSFAVGASVFAWRVRRRFRNASTEFSSTRRQELRRNAQIGAGFGIFVAALLRGYDAPWALVVVGGVFLGGLPVVAVASMYLLIKRGHTL